MTISTANNRYARLVSSFAPKSDKTAEAIDDAAVITRASAGLLDLLALSAPVGMIKLTNDPFLMPGDRTAQILTVWDGFYFGQGLAVHALHDMVLSIDHAPTGLILPLPQDNGFHKAFKPKMVRNPQGGWTSEEMTAFPMERISIKLRRGMNAAAFTGRSSARELIIGWQKSLDATTGAWSIPHAMVWEVKGRYANYHKGTASSARNRLAEGFDFVSPFHFLRQILIDQLLQELPDADGFTPTYFYASDEARLAIDEGFAYKRARMAGFSTDEIEGGRQQLGLASVMPPRNREEVAETEAERV